MMNRLNFMQGNNINDFLFFVQNYGHIMTVFDICNTLNVERIRNLNIEEDNVNFDVDIPKSINSPSDIPIRENLVVYGERYDLKFNNINNELNINMKRVSE